MLVSAAPMLRAAEKGHYAIAAFNTNNLEWTCSILTAAEEAQSPVIIQCTSGAAKWQTSFKVVSEIVHTLTETMGITVPVALHLDHGTYEDCFKCIEAGFTSIMYDGSHEGDLPLVLHGGTGIPVDQVKRAISMGVAKINVNTDLQVAFAKATRAYIEAGRDLEGKGYDPRKLLKPGAEAIVTRAKELIVDFGSDGKGWDR